MWPAMDGGHRLAQLPSLAAFEDELVDSVAGLRAVSISRPDPRSNHLPGPRQNLVHMPAEQPADWDGRVEWHVEVRNPDTGLVHHDWTWCQICERVYRTESWVRRRWRCPMPECTGLLGDAFPWESEHFGPRGRHPRYPLIPGHGDWYPFL